VQGLGMLNLAVIIVTIEIKRLKLSIENIVVCFGLLRFTVYRNKLILYRRNVFPFTVW
jgi:hypothetical protein